MAIKTFFFLMNWVCKDTPTWCIMQTYRAKKKAYSKFKLLFWKVLGSPCDCTVLLPGRMHTVFYPNQQRILLAKCNIKHFCIGRHLSYHLSIFIYVLINRTALSTGHIFWLALCSQCPLHSLCIIFQVRETYISLWESLRGFTAASRFIWANPL